MILKQKIKKCFQFLQAITVFLVISVTLTPILALAQKEDVRVFAIALNMDTDIAFTEIINSYAQYAPGSCGRLMTTEACAEKRRQLALVLN